jgi:hypothetical protein
MSTTPVGLTCSYELDERLIVRKLGPGWDRFAIENGAPELASPHPIGQPLLMFLSDAATVHLYELLFKRVAHTRRPLTFPIRCDGAARRRFLELTVSPAARGGFLVSSVLVRSEPRRPILLFDRGARRRPEPVTVCSWCQRLQARGRWVEVEDAVALLRLFDRDDAPIVQSGVCDACERFMLTLLREDAKRPPP